jgi:hypothetical protein
MKYQGKILLGSKIVVHQVDGELTERTLPDGKKIYRGFFSTMEAPDISQEDIYRLVVKDGRKTKIKVLALLSDIAGMKVYSCYATQPIE